MKSEHGAVLLSHELLACFASSLNHGDGRRRESREYGSGAMLHVCLDSHAERLLGALHEVASAATMHVQLYSAGHNIASFSVDDFCVYDV